jgi:hypothetical protein
MILKNKRVIKNIIFICLVLITMLFSAKTSYGACISLKWTANSEADLDGYNIYYGTSSGNYGGHLDLGDVTEYELSDLTEGTTYYIALTAYDFYGNESEKSDEESGVAQSPSDTQDPTITITSPTSSPTYSTSNTTINIAGTASDNVAVTLVTWFNDRGGSGSASGTINWSVLNINLAQGENVIAVIAADAAGNTGTDIITINYTPPTTSTTSSTPSSTTTTSTPAIQKEYCSTDPTLILHGAIPEEGTMNINIPDNLDDAISASLFLTLFDPDISGEGYIYTNGQGSIDLPVGPYDNLVHSFEVQINVNWLAQGENIFRFTHVATWGYEVRGLCVQVLFSEMPDTTTTPSSTTTTAIPTTSSSTPATTTTSATTTTLPSTTTSTPSSTTTSLATTTTTSSTPATTTTPVTTTTLPLTTTSVITTSTSTIVSDNTSLSGTVSINDGDEVTYSTNVVLTLFATDDSKELDESAMMIISNDNKDWSDPEPYKNIKMWILSSGQGEKTVYVKFRDAAGNWMENPVDDQITYEEQSACDDPYKIQPVSVTASSELFSKSNVIDGDPLTIWSTFPSFFWKNQFITLDLGEIKQINGNFQIQISSDNINWKEVASEKGYDIQSARDDSWDFNTPEAQYIRVYVTKAKTFFIFHLVQIAEIEVYGCDVPEHTLVLLEENSKENYQNKQVNLADFDNPLPTTPGKPVITFLK